MIYPRIPDSEYPLRWARLQEAMAEAGLDLVLAYADDHAVAGPAHARYLADFAPHFEPVCILVPVEGQPILLSGPETETFALQTARLKDVRVIREFTHPDEEYPFTTLFSLKGVLHEASGQIGRQIRRVGLAGLELMPVKVFQALEQALAGAELIDAEGLLTGLRAVKSVAEQQVIGGRGGHRGCRRCRPRRHNGAGSRRSRRVCHALPGLGGNGDRHDCRFRTKQPPHPGPRRAAPPAAG